MADSEQALATKLKRAVRDGDCKTAKRLLKGGVMADSSLHITWFDTTLLHEAISMGNTTMVNILLENGAKVNQCSKDGRTPLHFACRSGNRDIVEVLLKYGSDVNHQTNDGRSALHIAAWKAHNDVARDLILAGASCNKRDGDKWTPLHWAAKSETPFLAEFLLEHGALANAQDRLGGTPLHEGLHHPHTLRVLLKHGADFTKKKKTGTLFSILFHQSSKPPNFTSVELLLKVGYCLYTDKWAQKNRLFLKDKCRQHLKSRQPTGIINLMQSCFSCIPTLSELCRNQIRSNCAHKKFIYQHLCELPLPQQIIDFVTLKHELMLDNT